MKYIVMSFTILATLGILSWAYELFVDGIPTQPILLGIMLVMVAITVLAEGIRDFIKTGETNDRIND